MARKEETIYSVSTKFAHYDIVDMEYDERPARILFSGDKVAAQSGIALDDKPDLLFDYNQRFMEAVAELKPKKVLIIGGGALTLPMALLAAYSKLQIDVVELDPVLPDLAATYFGFVNSERIHIVCQDGRQFLELSKNSYDLIIIDAFNHTIIPPSLRNRSATELLATHLSKKGGAIAINVISSFYGRNAESLRRLYANYSKVFDAVDIFPASRSLLSFWLPQNFVLIAQTGNTKELTLRFEAMGPPPIE